MTTCTELARKSTIAELVAAFQSAEREIRESFARIVAAEDALNRAFLLGEHSCRDMRVDASYDHGRDDFRNADRAIDRLQREAWSYIVDRLEARRVMSIERYAKLQDQLRTGELPPITEANVAAFVDGYAGSLGDMLKEAMQEVFAWLRPPGSKYKRNSELEIPPRVVISGMVEQSWRAAMLRVHYRNTQELIALENVFNSLDGKGQVAKAHQSELQMAIEAAPTGEGETALFKFRACKNGNLHLTFKRLDLLARFNAVAGGARLRPSQEQAA